MHLGSFLFFFFNDTATTEIYTLSLHDALPIYGYRKLTKKRVRTRIGLGNDTVETFLYTPEEFSDRKSTRLNSSHVRISYAVFCLKKKKKIKNSYLYYTNQCARARRNTSLRQDD